MKTQGSHPVSNFEDFVLKFGPPSVLQNEIHSEEDAKNSMYIPCALSDFYSVF
jgi:hypothetical protein